MYKLLIFDWDGTIIDSAARIISSMQSAAKKIGLDIPDSNAVRDIIGLGLPEAIQQLIPDISPESLNSMRTTYSHYYLQADTTKVQLFPEAKPALIRLAKKTKLAVATGKSRRGLEQALNDTDLGSLFITTRCADETASKPNPLMLEEILAEQNLEPANAVMIGDTTYDLEMAQHLKMDTIAVSYGVHTLNQLEPYQPTFIANDFIQLENWLNNHKL